MNVHGSTWIRADLRVAIYFRDGWLCAYCGRNLRNAARHEITLDHILARSKGGTNEITNLVTACLHCNSSRQNTTLHPRMLAKFKGWALRPVDRKAAQTFLAERKSLKQVAA